ncbi:hypothetical protein MMAGJ_78200 [Mycolicibacterium mageritense]|uniref:Cutinase family protein n=1 Tax=Mycolicibacterium mageritense TaxID=53462 RepID=A0ABM7I6E6_MYCME|nr:hypothetical protein MMAGJ_78200 [Mycolicibacterium mageritense]
MYISEQQANPFERLIGAAWMGGNGDCGMAVVGISAVPVMSPVIGDITNVPDPLGFQNGGYFACSELVLKNNTPLSLM